MADDSLPLSIASGVNALLGDPDACRRMGAAGAAAFDRDLCYDKQFEPVLAGLSMR